MPPIEITCPPSFEPDEWEAHKRDARYIIWQRGRGELDVHHGYLAGQLGLFNYAKNYFSVLDAVSVEEDAAGSHHGTSRSVFLDANGIQHAAVVLGIVGQPELASEVAVMDVELVAAALPGTSSGSALVRLP